MADNEITLGSISYCITRGIIQSAIVALRSGAIGITMRPTAL